jgi:hypothetical protein
VAEATPVAKQWPLGVVRPPQTGQTIFKKRKLIWPLGVADPPPRAMGWHHPPPSDRFRLAEATPMALGGGRSTTPRAISKTTQKKNLFFKILKNIILLYFLFFKNIKKN